MDSDQLVDVLLSAFGEKSSFLFGQQNILCRNSVTGKAETEAILFPQACSIVTSLIILGSGKPLICEFLLFRAQLESESELHLVIMSTMILDSLE